MTATRPSDGVSALQLQLRLHTLLTRAIASGADSLDAALDPCAQALATALHADALGIWTTDHARGTLRLRATSQQQEGTPALPLVAIGEAHLSTLASAVHPAIFRDPRFEAPLFSPPISGPEPGVTVCPLVIDRGRLVGVLAMARTAPLTELEEEAFGSVADLIAIAVEKQHAAERLREREDGLGTLIRTAPDGIIVMDVHSRIIAANPSVEDIFGYRPGELVGEDVTVLMPERFRARHNAGVRRYRETQQKRTSWHGIELVGLRKDGTEIPIEISFGEYVNDGQTVFTGFIRDISERKRVESRDRRRRRVIQTAALYIGTTLLSLQAADLLLPVLPLPGWTFRALVFLAFLGLPLSAAVAWGYDIAAHAPVPPRQRAALSALNLLGSLRPAAYLAVVLLVIAAAAAASRPLARTDRGGSVAVIAVLPFDDMGDTPAGRQLASGLTEDLLTELSAVSGLRVISRTSVLAAAGQGRSVAAIARDLGAGYVLEGSVRRADNRVRISVQLARGGADQHVWAATLDRELDDPFAVQTELARTIAHELRTRLSDPASPGDVEAAASVEHRGAATPAGPERGGG
jgi:PAS domain S-box-containing protein